MADSNTATNQERDIHTRTEEQFSDFYDRQLGAGEREAVEQHLAACDRCTAAYEEFQGAISGLSTLHKMSLPSTFDAEVEDTIRRRSAGRFFGRKAFGDRVPFELLAIIVLLIGLVIFAMLRSSDTGSLRLNDTPTVPDIAPGAKDVIPQPSPVNE